MTPRIRLVLVPALVSGVALTLFATGPAAASSYQVDRFDDATVNACILDANDCALRGAIIKANAHPGDDIVRLRTGNYTLSISGPDEDQCQTGDLDVRDTLLLEGDGPDRTVIDAAGIDRVLHVVAAGARLVVRGVTITGGNAAASFGGGVYLPEGALRLENCVVSYNESHYGAAIYDEAANTTDGVQIVDTWITGNTTSAGIASALYSDSLLLLERSTISGNSGGYSVKINGDDSTLRNSTISGNSNAAFDAGVNFLATGVTITSCTLADNAGGEILGSTYSISLKNTIVAGDCSLAAVTSLGGNLESPGHTCSLGASDLDDVLDPMLTALGWFGGPTPVHRPLPGSPAIDQSIATAGCWFEDQRSLSRPRDGGGSSAAVCDIGAVELAAAGEIFVETLECGCLTPWSTVVP